MFAKRIGPTPSLRRDLLSSKSVDYSDLDAALKDISDADEVHRQGERLQRGVDELAAAVKRLQAPNMKVGGTRSPASSY